MSNKERAIKTIVPNKATPTTSPVTSQTPKAPKMPKAPIPVKASNESIANKPPKMINKIPVTFNKLFPGAFTLNYPHINKNYCWDVSDTKNTPRISQMKQIRNYVN